MEADADLLMEYTRTRSEQAFRRLVERYGGTVHAICFRRLRDPHLTEDVAQMVFATLARKAASIEPSLVGPWLYQTANFISQDVARQKARRKKHERRIATERPKSYVTQDSTISVELVEEHLMQLDENSRNALVLRYLHNQSLAEIAEALKITPEATKKRLHRGLGRLRALMAESGVVSTIAVAESTLRGIRGGPLSPGFIDRLVGNLNSQGLFEHANGATPLHRPKNIPLVVGATIAVGLMGFLTIWRVNTAGNAPHPAATSIPIIPVPLTAQQRLQRRFSPLRTQSNLQTVLAMLSARTGEPFEVQWEQIKTAGIEPSQGVEEDFHDLTLGQALDQLLKDISSRPGDLRYVVERDRIVITVTQSDSPLARSDRKK
jgi:RNA polymerase sigma-70 factor (ECF subfamily)